MDKVLYISYLFNPFICFSGAAQRSNLLLRSVAEQFEVDLVYFSSSEALEEDASKYKLKNCNLFFYKLPTKLRKKYKFWQRESIFPKNEFCEQKCKEFLSKTDYKYIVVRYLQSVYLYGLQNEKNIVIDVDDSPIDQFKTFYKSKYANKRLAYNLKLAMVYVYTRQLIRKSYHAFFSNPNQIKYKNTSFLPNIPFPFFENTYLHKTITNDNPTVLFVGAMGYLPNYKGVKLFLDNVWKNVKLQVPTAVFKIIGKDLPEDMQNYISNIPDVEYLGLVEDLFAEYAKCDAIVVPIYDGAGTNIKVLEGMTTGKPCVISEFASRGFEKILIDEENIMIAKSYDDYAEKIVKELIDKDHNQYIAKNAKEAINNNYSYEDFRDIVHEIL